MNFSKDRDMSGFPITKEFWVVSPLIDPTHCVSSVTNEVDEEPSPPSCSVLGQEFTSVL